MAKFLDEAGLAELWSLAREADARIVTGLYIGTGKVGASNPNVVTLDFTPDVFIITLPYLEIGADSSDNNCGNNLCIYASITTYRVKAPMYTLDDFGNPKGTVSLDYILTASFENNAVSWYSTKKTTVKSYAELPNGQLNISGEKYGYIAIKY